MHNQNCCCYNGLGWFYDRYWSDLAPRALRALDRLLIPRLPRHARILDIGCGAGHVAAALGKRGFQVTGIDASEDMLQFARRNAPRATVLAADARQFAFHPVFDAAVSTFDSMNHMLSPADLEAVLRNVRQALAPGGLFAFDLNMSEAFETQWHKSSTIAAPDHFCYVRGRYDRSSRIGTTEVTLFRLNGTWARADITMQQRCYRRAEVKSALVAAGFTNVKAHQAASLGLSGRLAVGRCYFVAELPAVTSRRLHATAGAEAAIASS
ncbi:MAG TPA: class I SAM-dependent methyltransferase [Bryobacteraceae bacterium]|nr:class I SAM-dependent methyltransferase [Bryobacteraceae bacterium]